MGVNQGTDNGVPAEPGVPLRLRRGVKAFVTGSERVLLQRERHRDGSAFWTLPGGGMRSEETATQALRRELREELQCGAVIGSAVGQFPYAHLSRSDVLSLYTVYECTVLDRPLPNRTDGVDACRWVQPNDLPAGTIPQVRSMLTTAQAKKDWA